MIHKRGGIHFLESQALGCLLEVLLLWWPQSYPSGEQRLSIEQKECPGQLGGMIMYSNWQGHVLKRKPPENLGTVFALERGWRLWCGMCDYAQTIVIAGLSSACGPSSLKSHD